jgi:hypothetical protein
MYNQQDKMFWDFNKFAIYIETLWLSGHRIWVVETPALYSGSHGFKSRRKNSYPEVFVVFLSPSRQLLG